MGGEFANASSLERHNGLDNGFLPGLYGLEASNEENYEVGTIISDVRWRLVSFQRLMYVKHTDRTQRGCCNFCQGVLHA